MKIKELIEQLDKLDPEMMVIRAGFEGGVKEINNVNTAIIALNVNTAWYYGEHEVIWDEDTANLYKTHNKASAAYLS